MKAFQLIVLFLLLAGFYTCKEKKPAAPVETSTSPLKEEVFVETCIHQAEMTGIDTTAFKKHYAQRFDPPAIDLNEPLENKNISELSLMKNTLLAMKGTIFSEAMYNQYFSSKSWYQPPVWDTSFQPSLTTSELSYVRRIDQRINELSKLNQLENGFLNPGNAINLFQFPELDETALSKLALHGICLLPGENTDFFSIYLDNLSQAIPSYLTTDLLMSELHSFFNALENEVEENYLSSKLSAMLEEINLELYAVYEKTLEPSIERAIEETLLTYAIPYAVITGIRKNLIGNHQQTYVNELTKVLRATGDSSRDSFDYAIFEPAGHYSTNLILQKYFKAVTWLSQINLCMTSDPDFRKALITAYIIQKNEKLRKDYQEYVNIRNFFTSRKPQFTVWDLSEIVEKTQGISQFEDLFQPAIMNKIKQSLPRTAGDACRLTVSFFPNESQNLYTDLATISGPSAQITPLELFASLGNQQAIQLLKQQKSTPTREYLQTIRDNLAGLSVQPDARSMDWLSTLLTTFNEPAKAEGMVNGEAWRRKDLSSAIASWVLLNYRFFPEQTKIPVDEKPSRPKGMTIGGIESNTAFWNAGLVLLENTTSFLAEYGLKPERSIKRLDELKSSLTFLEQTSRKMLKKQPLSKEEYGQIKLFAESEEKASISQYLLNDATNTPQLKLNTTFFTTVGPAEKDECLHAGTGHPNNLYVLILVEDQVYIARGAVYSYHEFNGKCADDTGPERMTNSTRPGQKQVFWTSDLFIKDETGSTLVAKKP